MLNSLIKLKTYALVLLACTYMLSVATANAAEAHKAAKICTGPTTGTYYQYAGGIIEAAKSTLGLALENVTTNGTLENAQAITSGRCDMALVQADIHIHANTEFHASTPAKLFSANLGTAAALYPEVVHLLEAVGCISGASSAKNNA